MEKWKHDVIPGYLLCAIELVREQASNPLPAKDEKVHAYFFLYGVLTMKNVSETSPQILHDLEQAHASPLFQSRVVLRLGYFFLRFPRSRQ